MIQTFHFNMNAWTNNDNLPPGFVEGESNYHISTKVVKARIEAERLRKEKQIQHLIDCQIARREIQLEGTSAILNYYEE